jgi:hypothetical protein
VASPLSLADLFGRLGIPVPQDDESITRAASLLDGVWIRAQGIAGTVWAQGQEPELALEIALEVTVRAWQNPRGVVSATALGDFSESYAVKAGSTVLTFTDDEIAQLRALVGGTSGRTARSVTLGSCW